jgi:hypothetical protein
LVDLKEKRGRVSIVAISVWVKQGMNAWTTAAGVEDGSRVKGRQVKEGIGGWAVWSMVEQCAEQNGIEQFGLSFPVTYRLPELQRRAGFSSRFDLRPRQLSQENCP